MSFIDHKVMNIEIVAEILSSGFNQTKSHKVTPESEAPGARTPYHGIA